VTAMARTMPVVPSRLPRREVSGCESPRKLKMKRKLATR
jgi:hypothetical protein